MFWLKVLNLVKALADECWMLVKKLIKEIWTFEISVEALKTFWEIISSQGGTDVRARGQLFWGLQKVKGCLYIYWWVSRSFGQWSCGSHGRGLIGIFLWNLINCWSLDAQFNLNSMWINLMRSYVGFCTIFNLTSLICEHITLKILKKKITGVYPRSVRVI